MKNLVFFVVLLLTATSCGGKGTVSVEGNPAAGDWKVKLEYTVDLSQFRQTLQELDRALAEVNDLEKRVLLQTPSLLQAHAELIGDLDPEPQPSKLLQVLAEVFPGNQVRLRTLSTNRAFRGLEQVLSEVRSLQDTKPFQEMHGELVALHAWVMRVERLVEHMGELAHTLNLRRVEQHPLATLVMVDGSPEELNQIEQQTGRMVKLQISNLRLTPAARKLLAGSE